MYACKTINNKSLYAVSYTHLTLPTKACTCVNLGGRRVIKKKKQKRKKKKKKKKEKYKDTKETQKKEK
ncbi:hypothetical protein, partial [Escherichia coli]|uniref:hypothetical protein n=1 Tax=Escherichia coli TaxID=562 RepID=UPI001BC8930B